MNRRPVKKVVLAYSGGLDTSVILRWLKETYRCEVVAWCADLGQGEELAPLREKALATGAVSYVCDDLREAFVRDFVFPALRANAKFCCSNRDFGAERRIVKIFAQEKVR